MEVTLVQFMLEILPLMFWKIFRVLILPGLVLLIPGLYWINTRY